MKIVPPFASSKPAGSAFLLRAAVLLLGSLWWWPTSTPAQTETPTPPAGTPVADSPTTTPSPGNPIFPGRYADPEIHVYEHEFWIYPTYSALYEQETFMDSISSPDLVHWTRHTVVDASSITWAKLAMWAPTVSFHKGRYYFIFGANDIHSESEVGGLGVAVADHPGGPFKDLLGKPLINAIKNGAQPIDPNVFTDDDGTNYLLYGGWHHCNITRLNDEYTGFVPLSNGQTFFEITPPGYTEGPFMFKRNGKYYFMWSQGGWGGPSYNVAYAIGDSPLGPFEPKGTLILPHPEVATSAGHHSVLLLPGQDRALFVYHRRPAGQTSRDARVLCIDWMTFNPDGTIQPVTITNEGVGAMAVPDIR